MVGYVTTYTTTRSQLQQALATCLDFSAPVREQADSFADLADLLLTHLTAHEVAQPDLRAETELRMVDASKWLAKAQEAGQELGKVRHDAYGQAIGKVTAPKRGSTRVSAEEAC